MAVDIFDNRKIKQIRKLPDGDAIIVVWMQILCLAGQTNNSGMVYFAKDIPYTDEMLAVEFDRPINLIRLALATFERFKMIEIIDDILLVSNWEKYQSTDKLEKIKEQNRLRKQKQRENETNLIECHVTGHTDVTQYHATELELDIDIDKDKDKDKDIYKDINKKHKYGEYKNVFLTDKQLAQLKDKFPNDWPYWIETLSEGIELKGYKYKNHYLAITKWANKDNKGGDISGKYGNSIKFDIPKINKKPSGEENLNKTIKELGLI